MPAQQEPVELRKARAAAMQKSAIAQQTTRDAIAAQADLHRAEAETLDQQVAQQQAQEIEQKNQQLRQGAQPNAMRNSKHRKKKYEKRNKASAKHNKSANVKSPGKSKKLSETSGESGVEYKSSARMNRYEQTVFNAWDLCVLSENMDDPRATPVEKGQAKKDEYEITDKDDLSGVKNKTIATSLGMQLDKETDLDKADKTLAKMKNLIPKLQEVIRSLRMRNMQGEYSANNREMVKDRIVRDEENRMRDRQIRSSVQEGLNEGLSVQGIQNQEGKWTYSIFMNGRHVYTQKNYRYLSETQAKRDGFAFAMSVWLNN